MTISASYRVPAARDRVFAALRDPAVLQQIIDGCESLVEREDGVYEARLRVGLGAIKGVYSGEARLENLNPPESYTLKVAGRGGPGFVNASADIRLADIQPEETEIACHADVQVGGVIAAVGSRLVEVAARRMMDRFFANLADVLN